MEDYTPLEVAVAVSLYGYNVSPIERARKLYDAFKGDCAEMEDLVRVMREPTWAATELAAPTAALYVRHALERYGIESRERVSVNRRSVDFGWAFEGV